MNRYTKGALVNLRGTFRDPSQPADDAAGLAIFQATGIDPGKTFDPAHPTFKLHPPTGGDIVYAYPADAQLLRDAIGQYRVQYKPTQARVHRYRFESPDGFIAAGEKEFDVATTPF